MSTAPTMARTRPTRDRFISTPRVGPELECRPVSSTSKDSTGAAQPRTGLRARSARPFAADRRMPRDRDLLDGQDGEVQHDPHERDDDDRRPGDVEAQGAGAADDDTTERHREAAEVLADDRA